MLIVVERERKAKLLVTDLMEVMRGQCATCLWCSPDNIRLVGGNDFVITVDVGTNMEYCGMMALLEGLGVEGRVE